VILGSASWPHVRCELLNEREHLLRRIVVVPLLPFPLKALFECSNDRRSQTFPCKMRQFRGQRISFGILEIEALQNSTSRW
jgi:hypothetical protein